MELGQLCLRRGEEKKLLAGQQWIFDNEADWVDERCRDGEVIEVIDSHQHFVGKGFFNGKSKIVVRMLTRDRDEVIDRAFFRRRLLAAWENRLRLGFSDACRVVFGEADGLPGLTVDLYETEALLDRLEEEDLPPERRLADSERLLTVYRGDLLWQDAGAHWSQGRAYNLHAQPLHERGVRLHRPAPRTGR